MTSPTPWGDLNHTADQWDAFWRFVGVAQWGAWHHNPAYVSRRMATHYTLGEIMAFMEQFNTLKSAFYDAVASAPDCPVHDAYLEDLVAHVIGLGRVVFDEESASMLMLGDRAKKGNYRESFAYCFYPFLEEEEIPDDLKNTRAFPGT